MLSENHYQGLDRFAVRLVKKVGRWIVGKRGLLEADRHDIEQTLIIAVCIVLPRFDPSRGTKEAFITRVVRNKVRNIFAERQAGCRDYRLLAGSLQDPIRRDSDRDPVPWGETFDAGAYLRLTRGQSSPEEVADLVIDLERAIQTFPASLRATWEILLLGLPDHEAASRLNISRQTLHGRRKRIARKLEEARISNYFNFPPDTSGPAPVGDK